MNREITAIVIQKKNENRVNVYLDDNFAFGLSRLVAAELCVGKVLNEKKIQELITSDTLDLGIQKALNIFRYRSRSKQEVQTHLRKHNFSEDMITMILGQLGQMNLVNDVEFATTWVENRSEFKPRGRIALRAELRVKGIDNEIIDEALLNIDEEKLAYRAAQKQSRKFQSLDWNTYQKKLLGFLARRGFNYSIARPVVRKTWNEIEKNKDTEIKNLR